jgi:hypothetical protein
MSSLNFQRKQKISYRKNGYRGAKRKTSITDYDDVFLQACNRPKKAGGVFGKCFQECINFSM